MLLDHLQKLQAYCNPMRFMIKPQYRLRVQQIQQSMQMLRKESLFPELLPFEITNYINWIN
jgi:hypothetical protein